MPDTSIAHEITLPVPGTPRQTARAAARLPPGEPMLPASSIPALLRWRSLQTPQQPGYAWRDQGRWRSRTWSQWWSEVQELAMGLQDAGLRAGGQLAIWAPSGREWDALNLAASTLGLVVVGIDERCSASDLSRALADSGPLALVVADERSLAAIPEELVGRLQLIITLADCAQPGKHPQVRALSQLQAGSHRDIALDEVGADCIATLIATSGTTGEPKAIAYDHRRLLLAAEAVVAALGNDLTDGAALCWMPLCHLFQRMLNLVAIRLGTPIHYVDDPRALIPQLSEINPLFLAGVPRFFEMLKGELDIRLRALPAWRRTLYTWAMHTTASPTTMRRILRPARHQLAKMLAHRCVRELLGDRMRFLITGSAPAPRQLIDYFSALGVPLLEAYGTSENTVPIALNLPAAKRPGSVGRPLWPNQVTIDPAGEILVRGPGLYQGYAGELSGAQPANERWTHDGFYRTGDLGHLDGDGYLFVTGRLRELIKTSSGQRISPAPIETRFAEMPGVAQVLVVGHGRSHLAGLMLHARHAQLLADDAPGREVRAQLQRELAVINRSLPRHHQIWTWGLLERPFSIETGEVTLNGKYRRNQIAIRHAALIEALFTQRPEEGAATADGSHVPGSPTLLSPHAILSVPRLASEPGAIHV